jgi:hypothetical protein
MIFTGVFSTFANDDGLKKKSNWRKSISN